MKSISTKATNTLATSVLLCLSFTAQAQYNPNGSYQGNAGSSSPDFQSSAAGAAAAASAAASSGMNAAANAANYQSPAAQFLQSSAPASAFGQSGTGYTNDGTLMMGGNKIGNPHQVLHDLNVPSFFGVNANRLTNTEDPTYGQGTLAQMENHTLTIGVPAGNVILSRLYLTPTNPYTEGVATPHNNFQTYQGVVAGAQAGSYQLTVANDNKLYAFKTLGTLSSQSQNILIKELPAHSVFIANSDPKGGAVAVRVTQSGDYAAMQNYFATVKPYDFSWRSAFGAYAQDPNTGAFVANWVQGSHQVQAYQTNLQNQSAQSGNEAFGVLAWDANQNRYVMLDATNQQATAGSVSGNMPTLGNNQFGFFGMHTHSGSSTPSEQDLKMTQQLGLDQFVIGTNGTQAIFTDKAGNNWQGKGFEFEAPKTYTIAYGGSGYIGSKGGGAQAGLYVTVDSDTKLAVTNVGHFTNVEFKGWGLGNIGTGIQITRVDVDKDTLNGISYSINVSANGSGTIVFNDKGDIIAVGGGFKGPIPGIAVVGNNTTVTSWTDTFYNWVNSNKTDSTDGTNTDASGNITGTYSTY